MTEPAHIAALHARYVQASGRPERLCFHEHAWHDLLHAEPYRGDVAALTRDVAFLVWYLKAQIDREQRMPGALRLRNFLQLDQFSSDLAEAIGQCSRKYRSHCLRHAEALSLSKGAKSEVGTRKSEPETPPPAPDPKISAEFHALIQRLRGPLDTAGGSSKWKHGGNRKSEIDHRQSHHA